MKKLILILLLIPILTFGQTDKPKRDFVEINGGVADTWGGWFPGVSSLWGRTVQYNNGTVGEYQIGLALPSIVTAKVGIGFGNLDNNIMLAVRPWPLTIGPQVKLGPLTLSAELGTDQGISFDAASIFTAGIRIKIKDRGKNFTNKKW